MKNKEKSISEMPESMYNESAAHQAEEKLNDCLSDLHYAIMDMREAGVNIESVADVKRTTSDNIRKQLAEDKAAYFRNMTYIPKSLKRQADEEFSKMASELLPLADALQKAYKSCPLPFRFKATTGKTGDYCVTYSDDEYNQYIKSSATMTIAPEFREYYHHLQNFVKSWQDLQSAATELGINKPSGALIKELMGARDIIERGEVKEFFNTQSTMTIDINKMFNLLRIGFIKKSV